MYVHKDLDHDVDGDLRDARAYDVSTALYGARWGCSESNDSSVLFYGSDLSHYQCHGPTLVLVEASLLPPVCTFGRDWGPLNSE